MVEIFDWGSTELLLLCFNALALYVGFHFLFTRVRNKMRVIEDRHRDNVGSRSLFTSSLYDESE
ncbi:MAG: hypothetical protein CMA34_00555 [Euryarchaeota archaeon]|nr:hypothetical protein [Euryarchaeota archaeon]|tara:strand:- start:1329 stop:1520 length:192 start_codon:yes stop_codon:yes gene_type:complete